LDNALIRRWEQVIVTGEPPKRSDSATQETVTAIARRGPGGPQRGVRQQRTTEGPVRAARRRCRSDDDRLVCASRH
jgi:hypothetical protein